MPDVLRNSKIAYEFIISLQFYTKQKYMQDVFHVDFKTFVSTNDNLKRVYSSQNELNRSNNTLILSVNNELHDVVIK